MAKIKTYILDADADHEPTEEQLTALMKEVAKEAQKKHDAALEKFFHQINQGIRDERPLWKKTFKLDTSHA